MTIERMSECHIQQIAELEKLCFNDPWSVNSIAYELNNRLSLWLVAIDGEQVVGYVGSQTVLGETDMMNIAIHPNFRNKGIATELIYALIKGLSERGSHSLMLEVRATNEPAKRLYEKMGFESVGVRRNYYRNPREDALILRKEWEL